MNQSEIFHFWKNLIPSVRKFVPSSEVPMERHEMVQRTYENAGSILAHGDKKGMIVLLTWVALALLAGCTAAKLVEHGEGSAALILFFGIIGCSTLLMLHTGVCSPNPKTERAINILNLLDAYKAWVKDPGDLHLFEKLGVNKEKAVILVTLIDSEFRK